MSISATPVFEDYLISKRIDSESFRKAEPELWQTWKVEFEQTHPNSFTVQKLNLINPIRRKYLLQTQVEIKVAEIPVPAANPAPSAPKPVKPLMSKPVVGKPVMSKPVMKPKQDPDKDPQR